MRRGDNEWSAECEVETSLVYSLPCDVAQGDMFDTFCRVARSDLEIATYRVSRIGDFAWRLGTMARVPRERLSRRCSTGDYDRLSLVRALTDDTLRVDERIISELKCQLSTQRTARYAASVDLYDNVRYPLLLEDSVAMEVTMDSCTERALACVDDDTSDNNLGLSYVNRVSFRAKVRERMVRISMRATLNEYHEIAYQFELECEKPRLVPESAAERAERHVVLERAFTRITLPVLRDCWPDGLRLETARTLPPRETLDDASRWIMLTDRSYGSEDAVLARTRDCLEIDPDTVVKLKYDGTRAYAYMAHGVLTSDSRVLRTPDDEALCGLYVYQLETIRDNDAIDDSRRSVDVITEVSFLVDHRMSVAQGGSALARQIERTERVKSREQQLVETAYVVNENVHLWPRLLALFQQVADLTFRTFVNVSITADADRATSTIVTRNDRATPTSTEALRDALKSSRFAVATCAADLCLVSWPNLRSVLKQSGADRRSISDLLVPVDTRFSNDVLCALHARWAAFNSTKAVTTVDKSAQSVVTTTVSRPFTKRDIPDEATLRSLWTRAVARTDGVLVCSRVYSIVPRYTYVKLKAQQTLELTVSWNCDSLEARDMTFADRLHTWQSRCYDCFERTCDCTQWTLTENGRTLLVRGIRPNDRATAAIAELQFLRPYELVFLRWRPDKQLPDSARKATAIVINRAIMI